MYKIRITKVFKRNIKSLLKKYANLLDDIVFALENFDRNTSIYLGKGLYKIRLKSDDLNKGKSGSFRMVIYLEENLGIIIPIFVFYKGNIENIGLDKIKQYLLKIIEEIGLE